jgi:4-alpha-glucanotransferase
MDEVRLNEIRNYLEQTPTARHWQRIGVQQRRGVCVPLFSLRSHRNCGIGDVADLRQMVDWCDLQGLSVVQILPINDMGLDGVPYSALSAFALDPIFIALDEINVVLDDGDFLARVRAAGKKLFPAKRVDYLEVRRTKIALLEEAFARADGPALQETLYCFRSDNQWLDDYLPYRVLKEAHDYRSWEDWGHFYDTSEKLRRFEDENEARYRFYCYLQWLAYGQFAAVREYASSKGVLLKGDIPILVARDSADVWRHPEYFDMETAAGAPPDMYSEDGQYWGFPTYNWDELARSDYRWWRQRLAYAQCFFDLYRIDHVVGFFRIWTIQLGAESGREGWFVPGDESRWGDHGYCLLKMMLDSTHMLPLAEDLGTIPPVCRKVLTEMGICGLKVQRWEKRWEEDSSIIQPEHYPPLSVATVSTHDSETLAGWWQDYSEDRLQLWHHLGGGGEAPPRLDAPLQKRILDWVASGNSIFTIFMLQDLLRPLGKLHGDPKEHRINVPGTVAPTNWSWRCPVTIEELLAEGTTSEVFPG